MANLQRQMMELAALCGTMFVVWLINKIARIKTSEQKQLPLNALLKATSLFILFVMVLVSLNFPGLLEPTHIDVVEHKAAQRQACYAHVAEGRVIEAYTAVRDNDVGKQLAADYLERLPPTLVSTIAHTANQLIFSLGAFGAILPVVLYLFIGTPIRLVGRKDWQNLLPLINVITAYTAIVFFVFHIFIDGMRNRYCVLISGHWFTYIMTSFSTIIVYTHLRAVGEHVLRDIYPAFIGLYQVVSLLVLRETQMFYHDSLEAQWAMWLALIAFLAILPVALYAEVRRNTAINAAVDAARDGVTRALAAAQVYQDAVKESVEKANHALNLQKQTERAASQEERKVAETRAAEAARQAELAEMNVQITLQQAVAAIPPAPPLADIPPAPPLPPALIDIPPAPPIPPEAARVAATAPALVPAARRDQPPRRPNAATAVSAHDALMEAIKSRQGILKKVEQTVRKENTLAQQGGLMGALAARLAARRKVQELDIDRKDADDSGDEKDGSYGF